jgi:hypothetical protein
VLTLRAGGNLTIDKDLVDHPTPINVLPGNPGRDSWALNLAAGADLMSADSMAVNVGAGNLSIGPDHAVPKLVGGKMVYTESAPTRFASGGDTLLRSGPSSGYMVDSSMRYTMGTFDGEIHGRVGGSLTLRGGAIQTATGDVYIRLGRDLIMEYGNAYGADTTVLGSVRTTGRHPDVPGSKRYWEFTDGGDIKLELAGSVNGRVNTSAQAQYNAWDSPYQSKPRVFDVWAASYPWSVSGYRTTEGIATMAGGDLTVHSGGDFYAQTGTFGKGDLNIYAGGNIDGRFLVNEGAGEIHGLASFGVTKLDKQSLELFDGQLNLSAQGDVRLGSIINPLITHWSSSKLMFTDWDLQYDPDTKVKLSALTGDVVLLGDSAFHALPTDFDSREKVLPSTLEIHAARDILLQNEFALCPSPTGNLILEAGRDIEGGYGDRRRSSIVVSDIRPSDVYGLQKGFAVSRLFNRNEHAESPVHEDDPVTIMVQAGRDIKNLQLSLPKKAEISAGRDIRDIYYFGQNVNMGDLTQIKAGQDIRFSSAIGTEYETGIVHGGPGTLLVQAGGDVDLGTTSGVQTVGSGLNPALGIKGSDLILAAGIDDTIQTDEIKSFFDKLRDSGTEYTRLRNNQDVQGAEEAAEKARADIITPMVGEAVGKTGGRIDMVRSQISTSAADDHIYVLARGDLNVGKSTFVSDSERKNTGIFTASGGSINILGGGDVNVNESRVMSFRGGDITVYALWHDGSTVNAGRGSKTAINVEPPKFVPEYEYVNEGGKQIKRIKKITLVFEPPAVGSGIRTLTYDPDGAEGPLAEPLAGDIYIFAKTIDAGEAGIAGRNVILGAAEVLNAQNISFSGTALGVPAGGQGAVGLGALSGVSSLSEANKMAEQSAGMAASRADAAAQATKMMEEFRTVWVDVKVIEFDE